MPNPKNPALASDSDDETTQSDGTVVEHYRKGSDNSSDSDVETSSSDQQTVVETYHSEKQEQIKKLKQDIAKAKRELTKINTLLVEEQAKKKQTLTGAFFGALNSKAASPPSEKMNELKNRKTDFEHLLKTKQDALAEIERIEILSSFEKEKASIEKEIELLTAKIARIKDIDNDCHAIEHSISEKEKAIAPLQEEWFAINQKLQTLEKDIKETRDEISRIQNLIQSATQTAAQAKPQGFIAGLVYAFLKFFFGQRPYESALDEVTNKNKWMKQQQNILLQLIQQDQKTKDEKELFEKSDDHTLMQKTEQNIVQLSKDKKTLIAEKGNKSPARLRIDIEALNVKLKRDLAVERAALIAQCAVNQGMIKDKDEPDCKIIKSKLEDFLKKPTLATLNLLNSAIGELRVDRMTTILLHKAQVLYPEIATVPSTAEKLIPIDPTSTVLILSEKMAENTETINTLAIHQINLIQKIDELKQQAQQKEAWLQSKETTIEQNRSALYDLNTLLIMVKRIAQGDQTGKDEKELLAAIFLTESLTKIAEKIKLHLPQCEIDKLALEQMSTDYDTIKIRYDNDKDKIQKLGNLSTLLLRRVNNHDEFCEAAFKAIRDVFYKTEDSEKDEFLDILTLLDEENLQGASIADTNKAFMTVKAYLSGFMKREEHEHLHALIQNAMSKIDDIDKIEDIFNENRPWIQDADIKKYDNDTTESTYHQYEKELETTHQELATLESLNESLSEERQQLADESIKHYHTEKLDEILEQCAHKLMLNNPTRIALKNYLNTPTEVNLVTLEKAMTADPSYNKNEKLLPLIEQAGAIRTEIDEIHQRLKDNNIPDSSHHL